MIAAIFNWALSRRFVVLLLAAAMIVGGIWAFRQLKVEAYPDISETQVIVITLVPGRAAEEIEKQVTIPVERALQSVPRAVSRRSRTIFGLSVVDITFDYGVDDSFARQVVIEKLRDVELPEGAVRPWRRRRLRPASFFAILLMPKTRMKSNAGRFRIG